VFWRAAVAKAIFEEELAAAPAMGGREIRSLMKPSL